MYPVATASLIKGNPVDAIDVAKPITTIVSLSGLLPKIAIMSKS